MIECEPVNDPSPFEYSTRILRVFHKYGQKVTFCLGTDGSLVVTGDPDLLTILSQNANALGLGGGRDYHIHIEYLGEDHYVGKDSIPMVFLCWADRPRRDE